MSRLSVNPAILYANTETPKKKEVLKDIQAKETSPVKTQEVEKTIEKKSLKEAVKVDLSERSKELKEKLSSAEKAIKIHQKKFGNLEKPGLYFVSGFDWFGAGSIKGNYDGIVDMAEAIDGAKHFSWDEQDEIIEDIKKRKPNQPIVLVGHSFGGDGIVEIAEKLNTVENGFRKIDLLITLDSVGTDNDLIPENVKKNLNYIAQGPYDFLNDGPNLARNYQKTSVENYLRHEEHADLDDATEIQMQVMEEIEKTLA